MSRKLKVAAVLLSAAFTVEGAMAADRCATPGEIATLRVAALQQQLMVAALTCHEVRAYNRFVIDYRPQLQRSDHAMLALFMRKDGRSGGDAHYNAYKTKLANVSMLQQNADSGGYCSEARAMFEAAAANRGSLYDFVAAQHVSIRLPFEDCTEESALPPRHRVASHRGTYEHRQEADARPRRNPNWDDEAPAWRVSDD